MLERLRVSNFALIDKLELSFAPGLNILTGETGTGKSILLGALSVVLGERVTDELFRSDNDILEVEATFSKETINFPQWIDPEEETLIILRTAGKNKRAQNFVNQRQITQTGLAELGEGLVDIHGQHQHQLLLKPSTHGKFLDAYGGLLESRERYARTLVEYKEVVSRTEQLRTDLERRREQRDFFEFQLEEIRSLAPKPGEREALDTERELLASAERRAELAGRLIELVSEQDASILEGLALTLQMIKELAALDSSLQGEVANIASAEIAADEVWRTLVRYRESIEYSPERLEQINERLFAYEKLCRKHSIDESGLIRLQDDLRTRLESIDLDAEEIERLQKKASELLVDISRLAHELSQARVETKNHFERAVEKQLEGLAMPRAKLKVEFIRTPDPEGLYEEEGIRYRLGEEGLEQIQFLFSANPGEEPKPLSRIASGGELSRIMLALKTVLVKTDRVPVLVFDEIDVGIGGRTAETVGKRLKELASAKQILLVTHLPQITRYADRHFRVSKEVTGEKTFTRIEQLDEHGRVEELARMLAGEEITDTVRAHAEELLEGPK